MSGVLPADRVAEIAARALRGWQHAAARGDVPALARSHEALRAERDRLERAMELAREANREASDYINRVRQCFTACGAPRPDGHGGCELPEGHDDDCI